MPHFDQFASEPILLTVLVLIGAQCQTPLFNPLYPQPICPTKLLMFVSIVQIMKHWSMNLVPKMTIEKLQALSSNCIPSDKKENILRVWNERKDIRLVHCFLVSSFNDAAFILYLHKYIFWFQLKTAVVKLLAMLLKVACKIANHPSIEFEDYINNCRASHWIYANMDQIIAKEINKSWEWAN